MAKYGAWDEKGKVIKHWRKAPKAETHPQKAMEFLQGLQK